MTEVPIALLRSFQDHFASLKRAEMHAFHDRRCLADNIRRTLQEMGNCGDEKRRVLEDLLGEVCKREEVAL